ncbi:1-phosphofructokinase family hexose kinase, partial [bacterium]|nr:1-phosphofructokinase family hexose kinase [bacterium]
MKPILCIGLTPAVQETRECRGFRRDHVNRCLRVVYTSGGKGPNTAHALAAIGAPVTLLGFIGGPTGAIAANDLRRVGVTARLTPVTAPTRVCTTILDRADGTVTEFVEEAALPRPAEWRALRATYTRLVARAGLVTICGALLPGADPNTYRWLARQAARAGVPVIIDSQRDPLLQMLGEHPWLAKLNVHELETTLGRRLTVPRGVIAGARELLAAGAQRVLVTHGARGAWLVTPAGAWHFRPPRLKANNSVGSGDATTAGIADARRRGQDPVAAVAWGMACGAANVLT